MWSQSSDVPYDAYSTYGGDPTAPQVWVGVLLALVVAAVVLWVVWLWLTHPAEAKSHHGPRWPANWPREKQYVGRRERPGERRFVSRPVPGALLLATSLPPRRVPQWLPGVVARVYRGATTRPVYLTSELLSTHVGLVGPTGGGKTSQGIVPLVWSDLRNTAATIVTVDAKGSEQFFLLGAYAARCGATPHLLDAWSRAHTSAVEPLWGWPVNRLAGLVTALIDASAAANGPGKRDFWERKGRPYLQATLVLAKALPRGMCTLPCVVELVQCPAALYASLWRRVLAMYEHVPQLRATVVDAARLLATTSDAVLTEPALRTPATQAALALVDHLGPEVVGAVRAYRAAVQGGGEPSEERFAAQVGRALRDTAQALHDAYATIAGLEEGKAESMQEGVRATVASQLEPLRDPEVAPMFSWPDLDLAGLALAPERAFVCVGLAPHQDVEARFAANLCTTLVIRGVQARAQQGAAGDGNATGDAAARTRTVRLYADEVRRLALADLPNLLTTGRSMYISVVVAYQDPSQLDAVYGRDAGSVRAGLRTTLVLPGLKHDAAKVYAAELGQVPVRLPTGQQDAKGRPTFRIEVVPRLRPDELARMEVNGVTRSDAALVLADRQFLVAPLPPFYESPEIRADLGLVARRSADGRTRWEPGEAPAHAPGRQLVPHTETDDGPDAWDALGQTAGLLLAPQGRARRGPLRYPRIDWPALGLTRPGRGVGAPDGVTPLAHVFDAPSGIQPDAVVKRARGRA